ncbi:hypothetical protein ACTXM3_10360 [Glutamicibacter arilaitensis]|uniref:hypothetical protein n=1 Tax=Glutamicibacter arilaitensis TaxID=256701 RepID=UPI003FD5C3A3
MNDFSSFGFVEWVDFSISFFTVVGVILIFFQIVGERSARHREFENMYVQRYWSITERLPSAFVIGRTDYELDELQTIAMRDYVSLCEDELDLRKRGFITDRTWAVWRTGISAIGSDPRIREVVDSFGENRLDLLRTMIDHDQSDFDPNTMRRFSKWWKGLSG